MQEEQASSSNDGRLDPDTNSHKQGTRLFAYLFYTLLVGIIVSGTALWLFSNTGILSFFQTENNDLIILPLPDPTGNVMLNLTDETKSALYRYDFDSGSLSQLPFNLLSPNLSRGSGYVIGSSQAHNKEGDVLSGIFVWKGDGVFGDIYASSTVTETFRNSKISSSGKFYSFEASPAQNNEDAFFTPDDWKIYIGNTSTGTPEFTVNGMYSHFTPDEKGIMYLKNDGLHIYNFITETDSLVYSMEEPTSANMMLNVSQDGSRIAFVSPTKKQVVVVDVFSWSPFVIGEKHVFNLYAFWPVLSPDSQFVAVQRFDATQVSGQYYLEPKNARLSVIHIASGNINDVFDLSPYNQNELFMSDWVDQNALNLE